MGVAQEAKMVKRILFFVVLPLVVYSIGMVKLHSIIAATEAKIAVNVSQIKNYYSGGFAMPNEETIASQSALVEEARTKLASIMSYSCLPMLEMPADVQEYGVYFKERLYLTEKSLTAEAKTLKAALPEDLGFADDLPSESQVPFMIMQLEFVEDLLRHFLQSNVKEILLLELEDSGTLQDSSEQAMPCKNITVKVSMNCSRDALKKALYEIGNMNPFVIVEGVNLKQLKSGLLEANVLITQLVAEGGI